MLEIPRTPAEQFENDYKLEHVVLEYFIEYSDPERKIINSPNGILHEAKLDFFGHCFEMTIGNTLLRAIFDHENILECYSELSQIPVTEKWNNVVVTLGTPISTTLIKRPYFGGRKEINLTPNEMKFLMDMGLVVEHQSKKHEISMTFLMNNGGLRILKLHYLQVNQKLMESFKSDVNLIVSHLLEDSKLVEMGKNFIDEMPVGFYTDINYLTLVENLIRANYSPVGEFLLLSAKDYFQESIDCLKEKRYSYKRQGCLHAYQELIDCLKEKSDLFTKEYLSFVNKNEADVLSYINDKLNIFSVVIYEKVTISDTRKIIFVTYTFIYNVVIEHLAKKFENGYKQYFQDIAELSLDETIERFCSIETVVHQDTISYGNFIYYLIKHGKFEQNNRNFLSCHEVFIPKLNKIMELNKHMNFLNRLKAPVVSSQKKYSIDDIDLMTGQEFETFIVELFSKMGYESEITKASGDQGIDVMATKNGNRIGIQAKCYSGSVGNGAIQEVVAGKNHYRLDKAIVITNNFFTDAAKQLAQSNSVILWDRNILKEKIVNVFNVTSS